jgi:hypothetical protein
LPELALIEGIQQVAMKRDESLSPSLFTFRSHFATIHHYYYYDFMTAHALGAVYATPITPSVIFNNQLSSKRGNLFFTQLKGNSNVLRTIDSCTVRAQLLGLRSLRTELL